MDTLRDVVEALLEWPGEEVWDGDGGWIVTLLEVSAMRTRRRRESGGRCWELRQRKHM